jgi:hypothetical protein
MGVVAKGGEGGENEKKVNDGQQAGPIVLLR